MSKLKAVGIRELKNKLSEYLREVRAGTILLVTDRGTVVAELREPTTSYSPVADSTTMDLWIEEGRIRAPVAAKGTVSPTGVHLPDGTAQSILDQDRGA